MVQISKINTVNNQNLTFQRGNMPAKTRKIAEKALSQISCQHIMLPGKIDYIRLVEKLPNGQTRMASVPTDYFVTHLTKNPAKGIRALFQKFHDAPSKDVTHEIL